MICSVAFDFAVVGGYVTGQLNYHRLIIMDLLLMMGQGSLEGC